MELPELVIELIDGGRGIRGRTVGRIPARTFIDVQAVLLEVFRTTQASCRYWFSDYTRFEGTSMFTVDTADIADDGRRLGTLMPNLVVASAANGDLEFGMLRAWEMQVQTYGWRTGTFRSAEAASSWMSATLGEPVHIDSPAIEVIYRL